MLPPSTDEPVSQGAPPERQPPPAASLRASTQERDEAVQRLQTAFAEGRLNDEEFDERMRVAAVMGGCSLDLRAPGSAPLSPPSAWWQSWAAWR